MFTSSSAVTHATVAGDRRAVVSTPRGRLFTRRLGTLAAAAAVAASLSVILPLESHAAPPLEGHGTVVAASTQSQASGGTSAVTFIVTKGQKG